MALPRPQSGSAPLDVLVEPDPVQRIARATTPLAELAIEGRTIPAIVTAALVIEHFCETRPRARMTEIARRLELPPSSCFSILKTLVEERILSFDAATKTYALDYGLAAIGRKYLTPGGALRAVDPILDELARRHAATLVIWRRAARHMVVVDRWENSSPSQLHVDVGARLPLLAGAMGRAMAAFGGLKPHEISRHFARVRWETPIAFDAWLAEVDLVRERGWAEDNGRLSAGISTVSVGVRALDGRVDAVLSATAFHGQHDAERRSAIAVELLKIGALLGDLRIGGGF